MHACQKPVIFSNKERSLFIRVMQRVFKSDFFWRLSFICFVHKGQSFYDRYTLLTLIPGESVAFSCSAPEIGEWTKSAINKPSHHIGACTGCNNNNNKWYVTSTNKGQSLVNNPENCLRVTNKYWYWGPSWIYMSIVVHAVQIFQWNWGNYMFEVIFKGTKKAKNTITLQAY